MHVSAKSLPLLVTLYFGWSGACVCIAQQNLTSISQSNAPTGVYVCSQTEVHPLLSFSAFLLTNKVLLFTLRLETNGTYEAEAAEPRRVLSIDGDRFAYFPDVVRGRWVWDAENATFHLHSDGSRTTERWNSYNLAHLRLDKNNTNHLRWDSGFLVRLAKTY